MPLYDFKCLNCGWEGEKSALIAQRRQQSCPSCYFYPLEIEFKPQAKYVPFKEHFDMGLGETVTSYAHKQKLMRVNHLIERDLIRPGEISARQDRAHEQRKVRDEMGVDRKKAERKQLTHR